MSGTRAKAEEQLEPIQQPKRKRVFTAAELAQKVLYFAYGSNVLTERLKERVGDVTVIGPHELKGFSLTFDCGHRLRRYANIIEDPKGSVQGMIYEMEYRQLRQLDKYEALYFREKGVYNDRKLHYYISELRDEKPGMIAMDYWGVIKAGCVMNKLEKLSARMDEELARGGVTIYSF